MHYPAAQADGEELRLWVVGDDGEVVGQVGGAGGAGRVVALAETGDIPATAAYGDGEGVEGDLTALNDQKLLVWERREQ